jgi:hypothetical protein
MAARLGTSQQTPLRGLRGFTFVQPTGWQKQAKEETASLAGIPVVLWHFTGVWHGYHIALHQRQEGYNLLIRGGLANLRGVQGRRMEEGIAATTVGVGTEDESGQQRCGWSQ